MIRRKLKIPKVQNTKIKKPSKSSRKKGKYPFSSP
jgi:hypothetical protein